MTEKELLEMPLHSIIQIDAPYCTCMRVVNGWIYSNYNGNGISSCFVPEPQKEEIECITDNEFLVNITKDEVVKLIENCPSEFTCSFPECRCFGNNKPNAVISNKETKVVKYTDEVLNKVEFGHAGGNNIGGDV